MREAKVAGGAGLEMIDLIAEVRVPRLLSIATVAEIVGRSPRTVRRRIDDGSLPAVVEHGQLMVRGDDLRAYIDGLQRPRNERPRRRRYGTVPYARLAAGESSATAIDGACAGARAARSGPGRSIARATLR